MISAPVTLVACIGGGQLGRMLGLAGLPLGLRFRFLDPSPDCPGRRCRRAGRRRVRRPGRARAPGGRRRRRHVRVRERAGRRRARRRAAAASSRARAGPGPPRREAAVPAPRDPDRALRPAHGDGAAGTRQVAAARLRRQGPAPGRGRRADRRARAGRGDRRVRSGALDHRRSRRRRGDPFLARSPRTCIATASSVSHGRPLPRRRRPRPRSSWDGCSTSSATSACSRWSCSRSGGRLLANEFAPRVHNTGHWTIDGAVTSQFENHLRAILGLPLGATEAIAASGDGESRRWRAPARAAARGSRAPISISTARSRARGARSVT